MKKIIAFIAAAGLTILAGCDKFLDAKPISAFTIPDSLKDLQALLDQYNRINQVDPYSGEQSSDDYYITDADYAAREEYDQRMYTWQNSNVHPEIINDWYYSYQPVLRANTVLDVLKDIPVNDQNRAEWRNVAGQAHFIRGKMFFQLLALFAIAYDEQTAATDPGIPIRLGTDFNERSVRASVKQGFGQILDDLKQAAALLPVNSKHVVRPSRPAAYALLARTFWYMRNYDQALLYADSCLQLKNQLLDYNTLNASAARSVPAFNTEILFESSVAPPQPPILSASRAKINLQLYQSYEANDLRKSVFFSDNRNGSYAFKGSYAPAGASTALAVDEILLIRAEAYARMNKLHEAVGDINTLLQKRYKTGTYINRQVSDKETILKLILSERRKELIMRGLRWLDIKRLNKEGAGINLSRTVMGKTFVLSANSPRFAIPIPEDVIRTSGMEQNKY